VLDGRRLFHLSHLTRRSDSRDSHIDD